MLRASEQSEDKNLSHIKEEFQNQVQSQLSDWMKIKEFIFIDSETAIFAILPNNVMVASLGVMKDMMTDPNLKNSLCAYEKAGRVLKCQFRNLSKGDNYNLLKANTLNFVGFEADVDSVQSIKNIFFSSYSTFELVECVRINFQLICQN